MTPTAVHPSDETVLLNGIPAPEIRAQLDQVLRSRSFIQSHRIRRFLQFVVQESLLGQPHRLKEYLIGLEVFDRRDAFDPRVDSIVRVEARRLRYKLEEYYRNEGREDPVRIILRKGSYVPIFEYRSAGAGPAGLSQRQAIEIRPLSLINPSACAAEDTSQIAGEIQRRLTHVLIREASFQVIASSPSNGGSGNGNGDHRPKPDYIVEGSLEFQPDHFHLILQLLQCGDDTYIWSGCTDGRAEDLIPVEQLTQALVHDLMASGNEIALRRHTTRKESRDCYLQGRYHWKLATPDSFRESVAHFTKAVDLDENYAAAWAALAEALLVSSMFSLQASSEAGPRMKDAARKATSLSPSLPEAHVALGSVLSILEWNWPAGEQELEKSIQLDKHDPVGHIAYGIHLACRGRLDSAVTEVERALELDPASLFPNFVLGWMYGICRRFDEAIAQHSLTARLAPDYGLPHLGLGLAYAGKGSFADAIAHLTNATQMKCRSLLHGQIGYCYAMEGRREEALRELSNLHARSESNYVSPVSFAAIHAALGDKEKALGYLEQAVETHDSSLPVRLLNTEFDSLRDELPFQALRQKIGVA
ncbi:MAG TPA: hypothetical protein VEV17_26580 [Bryobacteraceae bacterium]|nr:hypothetical protein [Bryobacteraceae bacterium]